MVKCTRTIQLNAKPEEIWAVIERFMHTEEYSPLVVSVEPLSRNKDGIGAKRRNFFENGTSITEEVIEWIPNKSQKITCSEFGPIPLHELLAEIDIDPGPGDLTTFKWSLDFKVKYGPIGWLMGHTIMKRAFGKVVAGNLDAISARIAENQAKA